MLFKGQAMFFLFNDKDDIEKMSHLVAMGFLRPVEVRKGRVCFRLWAVWALPEVPLQLGPSPWHWESVLLSKQGFPGVSRGEWVLGGHQVGRGVVPFGPGGEKGPGCPSLQDNRLWRG